MGKVRGFLEYERADEAYIPVTKRLKNYDEFTIQPKDSELEEQGGRCMDLERLSVLQQEQVC